MTTHSRGHTQSPQPASHWLSLAVTNSPCCTDAQKPKPSDKKSHINSDASVNQNSICCNFHFIEVFDCLFCLGVSGLLSDLCILSGGKSETMQEEKLALELWSRRVSREKQGWCFSSWSFNGHVSRGSSPCSAQVRGLCPSAHLRLLID